MINNINKVNNINEVNNINKVNNINDVSNANIILEEKNIYKVFLKLSLPIIIANLFTSMNTFLDTYLLGKLENSNILQSSISTSWSIINIFITFGISLSIGSISILSKLHGKKDYQKEEEFQFILFILFIFLGIITAITLYFISPYILNLMNAKKEIEIYNNTIIYCKIRSISIPFLFIFYCYQTIYNSKGDTFHPVILSIIKILIYLILSYVFLFIYNLNIYGISLSIIISEIIISIICIISIIKKIKHIKLKQIKIKYIKTIINKSLPIVISQFICNLGFIFVQGMILSFGKEIVSGFSIANQITNILLIPIMSFSTVLSTFIGQNIGANKIKRAKESFKISIVLTIILSIISIIILYPLKNVLLKLMTNNINTLNISIEYFPWTLYTLPMMGIFQIFLGLFHGTGYNKYSLYLSIFRLWGLRLPLLYIFIHYIFFDYKAIWYAMAISNTLILLLGLFLTRKVIKTKIACKSKENTV